MVSASFSSPISILASPSPAADTRARARPPLCLKRSPASSKTSRAASALPLIRSRWPNSFPAVPREADRHVGRTYQWPAEMCELPPRADHARPAGAPRSVSSSHRGRRRPHGSDRVCRDHSDTPNFGARSRATATWRHPSSDTPNARAKRPGQPCDARTARMTLARQRSEPLAFPSIASSCSGWNGSRTTDEDAGARSETLTTATCRRGRARLSRERATTVVRSAAGSFPRS